MLEALRRVREPVLWMALTYGVALLAGVLAVHLEVPFALAQRDSLVGKALASDPAAVSLAHGQPWIAALHDFRANLVFGAVPSTLMGVGVVFPFPVAAFRGWVGGIVSVDGVHASRLTSSVHEAAYYVIVIVMQLIPYSLAGGAGVRLGLGFLSPRGRFGYASARRWLGLPAEGLRDVALIYAMVVPLFALASTVEFLLR